MNGESREVRPARSITLAGRTPTAVRELSALPVTAPMAVRERLLDDLEGHNETARERGRDLDAIIEQNR